jgi:hypothetical protein
MQFGKGQLINIHAVHFIAFFVVQEELRCSTGNELDSDARILPSFDDFVQEAFHFWQLVELSARATLELCLCDVGSGRYTKQYRHKENHR